MLDNPEKTARLLAALKAAVPFEVDLTPAVVKQLQSEYVANADQIRRIVSDLSYAGDEGGIVCHIVPLDKQEALFISLTHVRMPRTMPLAAAVADYQKHRVKKLKKQGHVYLEFLDAKRYPRRSVEPYSLFGRRALPPAERVSATGVTEYWPRLRPEMTFREAIEMAT